MIVSKTQKELILHLLQEHKSVSNFDLNRVAFRYSARIKDLRDDGHQIIARKGKKKSEWYFSLIETPVQLVLKVAENVTTSPGRIDGMAIYKQIEFEEGSE